MDFPALTSLMFLGLTHFLGKFVSKKIIVTNSPSSSFIKRLVETKLKLSYQLFLTNVLTANSTDWACLPIPLTKEIAISRNGTIRRTKEFIEDDFQNAPKAKLSSVSIEREKPVALLHITCIFDRGFK